MKKPSWPAAILQFVIKALRWAIALVLLLFFAGPLVVSTLNLKRGNQVIDFIHTGRAYIDTQVAPVVRSYVPTKFGKEDWTVWIMAGALIALFAVLGAIQVRIKRSLLSSSWWSMFLLESCSFLILASRSAAMRDWAGTCILFFHWSVARRTSVRLRLRLMRT